MRDGAVVALDAGGAVRPGLARRGDGQRRRRPARPAAPSDQTRDAAAVTVRATPRGADGLELLAHRGEVVGLGGLSGQGQTELLSRSSSGGAGATVAGPVALVAGRPSDRRHLPAVVDRGERRRRLAAPVSARARLLDRERRARLCRGLARAASASAPPTWTTRSCRSRAATSRRRCSPGRWARTPRSSSWTTRCAASTSAPSRRSMP